MLDRLAVKFNYHVEEQNILPRTVCRTVLKTGGVFFNGRTSVHATGNKIICTTKSVMIRVGRGDDNYLTYIGLVVI